MTGGGNVELTEPDDDGVDNDAENGMLDINGESTPHNLNPHPPLGFARSDPSSPVVIEGGGGNFTGPDDGPPATSAPTLLSAIKSRKALTQVSEASLASSASIKSCFAVASSSLTDCSSLRNVSSSSESTVATAAIGFESGACGESVAVVMDRSPLVGGECCPNMPGKWRELFGGEGVVLNVWVPGLAERSGIGTEDVSETDEIRLWPGGLPVNGVNEARLFEGGLPNPGRAKDDLERSIGTML